MFVLDSWSCYDYLTMKTQKRRQRCYARLRLGKRKVYVVIEVNICNVKTLIVLSTYLNETNTGVLNKCKTSTGSFVDQI